MVSLRPLLSKLSGQNPDIQKIVERIKDLVKGDL